MSCHTQLGYSTFSNKATECQTILLTEKKGGEFDLGKNRNQLGRLRDDSCEVSNIHKESKGPGQYKLSASQQLNKNTYMEHPTINLGRLENRGIDPSCVDIESELYNLPRKDSKCPTKKYLPSTGNKQDCLTYKSPQKQIVPESTRMNKSCDITSGKSVLGYQFNNLCENPQELQRIHSNHIIGRNSRLCYKDNYKKQFDFKSQGIAKQQNLIDSNSCCKTNVLNTAQEYKTNSQPLITKQGAKHEEYVKNLRKLRNELSCQSKHTLN